MILQLLLGGSGRRFGGSLPKQYQEFNINGKIAPLFIHTLEKINREISFELILMIAQKQYHSFVLDKIRQQKQIQQIEVIVGEGGNTRHESFTKGISLLHEKNKIQKNTVVCVHDANRPFLSTEFLKRAETTSKKITEKHPCALPIVPVRDSLVEVKNQTIKAYLNREKTFAVQTPQLIHAYTAYHILQSRSYQKKNYTDEGSFFLDYGHAVLTFEGDLSNKKVTFPEDIA
ncbi:MAG: hypothetical protein D6767_03720 [Candidatus Hydrogenedentota bacterium]|nr:MAG: hypothetical protein D6767_03720 [Candidatus Hydrogenedentota bacterium]